MRVAITANRNLTAEDRAVIGRAMRALVYDVRPEAVYFGGARGGDTEALLAARHPRSYGGGTARVHHTRLVVIVPDTVAAQPHDAREAIRAYADEVVELGRRITRDDGFAAYHARNREMTDRATHVLGFWDGDPRSGTGSCLAYAARIGRPLWVERIAGGDR